MGTTDGSSNVNTKSDGQTPPDDDVGVAALDDFSRNRWIAGEKNNHGDNTVTEQDQDHCSEELCYKLLTFSELHCVNCFLGRTLIFERSNVSLYFGERKAPVPNVTWNSVRMTLPMNESFM